jgi:hypothetical protein
VTSPFLRIDRVAEKLVAVADELVRLRIGPLVAGFLCALSSSLMMVVIAMLVGIYDVAGRILLFALNATSFLFGRLMELHNQMTPRTNWTAYRFGSVAGTLQPA